MSQNDEMMHNLRDFSAALLQVLLDKNVLTLEEWQKYIVRAKQQLEQLDTEAREMAIADMNEGERFLHDLFGEE